MSEETVNLEPLVKRLDAMINILFSTSSLEGGGVPMSKRIEMLNSCGLRPVEISDILGRNQEYVNKELSRIRKAKTEVKTKHSKR